MPGYQPREGDNVTFVIGKNDRTGKTQAQDVQPA
jgi:cold shock CspA family protein